MSVRIEERHFSDEAIDQFLNGALPTADALELEAHVDSCDLCAGRMTSLAAKPADWNDVSSSLANDSFDADMPSFAEIDDDGSLLRREISGWLDPTDDPEMLGRFAGYEIVGVVGHGGMGIVLKGFERALHRFVAIKVLAPRLATSGAARKRFERESRAAAAVLHDNVIAIHRVDQWHSLPFLVMPYVAGESLQQRIDREGPLGLEAILRIGHQIAAGLAAAHAQGLVHRDIKPANILLDQGVERVTLTDFGLARAADDARLTQTGFVSGTPLFMSPEQASAGAVDPRSDLFSLGSVMYTMAAGRPPFEADENLGVLSQVRKHRAKDVREIQETVPDWLAELIDWCHAKSPKDRPASAARIEQYLSEWLAHLKQPRRVAKPTPVKIPSTVRRTSEPPNRWTAKLIATFGGLLLAFASILIVVESSKGTIAIESDVDNVPVVIKKSGKIYDRLTLDRDGKSIRVLMGEYEVILAGEPKRMEIENGSVTLGWGNKAIVRIKTSKSSENGGAGRLTNPSPGASSRAPLVKERMGGLEGDFGAETIRPTADVGNPVALTLTGEVAKEYARKTGAVPTVGLGGDSEPVFTRNGVIVERLGDGRVRIQHNTSRREGSERIPFMLEAVVREESIKVDWSPVERQRNQPPPADAMRHFRPASPILRLRLSRPDNVSIIGPLSTRPKQRTRRGNNAGTDFGWPPFDLEGGAPEANRRKAGEASITHVKRSLGKNVDVRISIVADEDNAFEVQLMRHRGPIDLAPLQELENIHSLAIHGELTNETLRSVSQLTTLKRLLLYDYKQLAQISDDGMSSLASLTQLKSLRIYGGGNDVMSVTSKGVAKLAPLKQLSDVQLQIPWAGFGGLQTASQIRHLRLWRVEPKHAKLAGVAKLSQLESLTIQGGEIAEEEFRNLSRLSNLEAFRWVGGQHPGAITDEMIRVLAKLPKLKQLSTGTPLTAPEKYAASKLTERSLQSIAEAKSIEQVCLSGAFNSSAVAQLLDARPDLHIVHRLDGFLILQTLKYGDYKGW